MILKEEREKIVHIGNLIWEEKLVHDMQGNISIYDPGTGLTAITPSAIPYRERKPESICVIDLNGKVIEGNYQPTSEYLVHTMLYKNRQDIKAVIHTHPIHSCTFAVIHQPIRQVMSQEGLGFRGIVPLASYAKPGTLEIAESVLEAMGDTYNVCLMENHGLVSVGYDIESAYRLTVAVEDSAEITIMAYSMGEKPHFMDGV